MGKGWGVFSGSDVVESAGGEFCWKSIRFRTVTVYTNVYTDTRDVASKNVDIRNSTLNYTKCNLPEYSAYITYNRLYACPSSDTISKFDINNLNDFDNKLAEIHINGSKLDICKTCTVAYSCLNVR